MNVLLAKSKPEISRNVNESSKLLTFETTAVSQHDEFEPYSRYIGSIWKIDLISLNKSYTKTYRYVRATRPIDSTTAKYSETWFVE